jgi:hypothetical protein
LPPHQVESFSVENIRNSAGPPLLSTFETLASITTSIFDESIHDGFTISSSTRKAVAETWPVIPGPV